MIGAQPHAADLPCVRYGLEEFVLAAPLVESLRRALDAAAGQPLNFHVFGGFARACITGEPFSDIDLAAPTAADRRALRKLRHQIVMVRDARGRVVPGRLDVHRRIFRSPAELVGEIELVMGRLAYSTTDERFHMDPLCLKALATQTIVLRPVRSPIVTPSRTICRTFKYTARGARLPLDTLCSLLRAYRLTPALARWAEHRLRNLVQPGSLATGARR